ncbi:DNA-directed DNA polymerase epsilon, subunit B [Myotisia sp. PD_48]|nr:DNA-directed DNA polymerase epsilon, subunit B [Myotisia sp. PD_48]
MIESQDSASNHHQPASSKPRNGSVLPVLLPPSTVRPLAFRTLSKKHNLAFTSAALQSLATFVGKFCGSGWREDSLAEFALDEVAKAWKLSGGGPIIEDGINPSLNALLRALEANMFGGRIQQAKKPIPPATSPNGILRGTQAETEDKNGTTPWSSNNKGLSPPESATESDGLTYPIRVVNALEKPYLTYNADKKDFYHSPVTPCLFPSMTDRVNVFRDRYYRLVQRLSRNEAFQTSTVQQISASPSSSTASYQPYKLSSITGLQGRGDSTHLLLGFLSILPGGEYCLSDPTGTVMLNMQHANGVPDHGAWFGPGMIILVDGIYKDDDSGASARMVRDAGAIGGKFLAISVAGPPCERRDVSMEIDRRHNDQNTKLALDPELGSGSNTDQFWRSEKGLTTRSLAHSVLQPIVVMGEVNLDNQKTLPALKRVLEHYNTPSIKNKSPIFLLIGNFVHHSTFGAGNCGSIEYKEFFDSLALVLAQFPDLLSRSSFVFVPGDNDPWASSLSAGMTGCTPRQSIPELFTSRVRRAIQTTHGRGRTSTRSLDEIATWTSNPCRLTIDALDLELVVYRDDISQRLKRNSVVLMNDTAKASWGTELETSVHEGERTEQLMSEEASKVTSIESGNKFSGEKIMSTAHRIVKSILDQGYLSPFPLSIRPILCGYASALHLYPLPTAIILVDPETDPFAITYEGCHAMNPSRFVIEGSSDVIRWVEYDIAANIGILKEETL